MHDAFQHMGNVRTSEPIITVAALLHEHDKPRGEQLAKMAAGSWWRYAGGISKLCRGERPPAKQRDEHIGPRRIADQCSDLRDLRCIRHGCQYVQGKAPLPPPMLRS
jgi:hypothetical protein